MFSYMYKHCQGGSCLNQQPITDDEEEDNTGNNFKDNFDDRYLIENQKGETNIPKKK